MSFQGHYLNLWQTSEEALRRSDIEENLQRESSMLESNVEVIELYGFARLILLDNNVLYTFLLLPTITKISLL